MVTGYLHSSYAESLKEFGSPRRLPNCEGWVIERQIPGYSDMDAMGCYPLFACRDWLKLHLDFKSLENTFVSLSCVADPFGNYDIRYLRENFDVVIPYKPHYVTDLQKPIREICSKRDLRYARKALRDLDIKICNQPLDYLDQWIELYANLIERHKITGLRTFSRESFRKQLTVPGVYMVAAFSDGALIGARILYIQEEVAYAHLSAFSSLGYELRATYGIQLATIEFLADKVCWLDLGGGAGIKNIENDGLSQYKLSWSTESRTAYFCGRIFNKEKYLAIIREKEIQDTNYFPAYRLGEFR